METSPFPGFRSVPRTGVIYVMHEAAQRGFAYDNPEWSNLGQGSPETGDLPGAPARINSVDISVSERQYSPIEGNRNLRQAVADYYNGLYRKGKASPYAAENVSIASGGRMALTRLSVPLPPAATMAPFAPTLRPGRLKLVRIAPTPPAPARVTAASLPDASMSLPPA